MSLSNIVKDLQFEDVAEVRVDSKNRITLGKNKIIKVHTYKVYRNSIGQIILDPQVTIPAHEQWLFRNKKAAKVVKSGLDDAKEGRLVEAREDYSKHIDD